MSLLETNSHFLPENEPFQKERIVFKALFFRGHSLVFTGVYHSMKQQNKLSPPKKLNDIGVSKPRMRLVTVFCDR